MLQECKNTIINNYSDVLEQMSKSTDDFLFFFDIKQDKNHFFGNIKKEYSICEGKTNLFTISELLKIVHPSDQKIFEDSFNCAIQNKKDYFDTKCRLINKSGKSIWVKCSANVIKDENGEPLFMAGRISESALRHLCNPLTGLFNQIKLINDLNKEINSNNNRYLMLIDIDDLSAINLSHGRDYGDMLLKLLAKKLEEISDGNGIYHAERNYFALSLEKKSDEIARIYDEIQCFMADKCTISAGVVPMNNSLFKDGTSLFDTAKLVLRKAKQKGHNSIEFFSDEEIKRKIASLELLEEFYESVNNGFVGFELYYQPQVKSGNYSLYSAEALLRYTSKSGKKVFPDEFIPLLEQSKLIVPVGMWVLETALTKCKEWRKTIPDMHVSVNFSLIQFKEKSIVEDVLAVVSKVGVTPDCLTAEITESVNLNEAKDFVAKVKRLKDSGVQIAIDDFGTGYSNIGYLKQMSIDEIKIDRSFIQGIEEGTYNFKIVSNTLDFAKMNSIRVCCEGVETTQELSVLESRSPDLIQGYLFNRPCNVSDFEDCYINSSSEKYHKMEEFITELYQHRAKSGIISFNTKDILSQTNVGLWVIRMNPKTNYKELHIDETMERIMGIDKKYTPKECYDFWYERICTEYIEYVEKNFNIMQDKDKIIQLQYSWKHPQLGEIVVRSNVKRCPDSNGMVVFEGYHRILTNIEEV